MTEDTLPAPAGDAVSTEIATLESESADNTGPYWNGPQAESKQARLRELYDSQEGPVPAVQDGDLQSAMAGDTIAGRHQVEGFETPTVEDWQAAVPDMSAEQAGESIDRAMLILEAVPEADRALFDTSLAGLPESARVAIVAGLSLSPPEGTTDASESVLKLLEERGCGRLLGEWGIGASRRVGVANARVNAVIDACETDQDAKDFTVWFNNLSGGELTAILRMVA